MTTEKQTEDPNGWLMAMTFVTIFLFIFCVTFICVISKQRNQIEEKDQIIHALTTPPKLETHEKE